MYLLKDTDLVSSRVIIQMKIIETDINTWNYIASRYKQTVWIIGYTIYIFRCAQSENVLSRHI